MKVTIQLTELEFNALRRLSATQLYDPDLFEAVARRIVLDELSIAGFIEKEEAIKGSFSLHYTPLPIDPIVIENHTVHATPVEKPVVEEPPTTRPAVPSPDFTLPMRYRNGQETLSYRSLKLLVRTMFDSGKFSQFTADYLARGIKVKEKIAYRTLDGMMRMPVPWLHRMERDDKGVIYWTFTEKAKKFLLDNPELLTEAGILEGKANGKQVQP